MSTLTGKVLAAIERASQRVTAVGCALSVALQPALAFALPDGGQVAAGQAEIISGAGATTITQTSHRAIIDWQSFDIGSAERVQFTQPDASAIALNRVHDVKASAIDGQLTANGNVWLVNPHGVFFGAGARVNVGGLLASTVGISNENFMAGDYRFDHPGNAAAMIVNEGQITVADAGMLAFVAPQVRNSGFITARLGRVSLGAGETFTVDLYGDELIRLEASGGIAQYLLEHSGTIDADGGIVVLTAAAGRELVDSLINVSGDISADTAGGQKGRILIKAATEGEGTSTTLVSGNVSATGSEGGNIDIFGDRIAILSGALIDASGATGGGSVLIGGDYQGMGTTPTATRAVMQGGSLIQANATENGNGGRVILWGDGRTDFHGRIEARGGAFGGNGGFVETSGKQTLSASGNVDAGAASGNAGTWLLDPNNITIQTAGPDTNVTGGPTFDTTNDSAIVTTGSIETALNAGTSVTVQTGTAGANSQAGDITVSNSISKTAGGDATLTLKAHNSILVNGGSDITSTSNRLNIVLNSDADASGAGAISISTGSVLTSNGGNITLGGGADPTATAAVGTASNKIGIQLGDATLSAGGGNISMIGTGYGSGDANHGIDMSSLIQTTGSGTITLTGIAGNAVGNNSLGVAVIGGITTINGDITLTGTGTGANSRGVYVDFGAVYTTGSGNVTLTGTGSASGVLLGNNFTGNLGGASQAGSITVNADSIFYGNGTLRTTGQVFLKPFTAATTIGINGAAGTLSINSALLNAITAGTLTIGRSDGTGLMRVAGYDASARNWNLSLLNGSANIQFDGGGTALGLAINKYLTATTTSGDITSGGNGSVQTSGSGYITLASGDDISFANDLDLAATGTGAITLRAGNSILSSGSGDITTQGSAITLNSDADASGAGAISIGAGSVLTSNGGNITLGGGADPTATAAYGTASDIQGINMNGAQLLSGAGAISLRGTGYGFGANRNGVYLYGGSIVQSTTGNITVNGTGGNGTDHNNGIHLYGAGTKISSGYGAISIAGTGGNGSSDSNIGVRLESSALIESTGTGGAAATIAVQGTGGNGTAADIGVFIPLSAGITSVDGNITVIGQSPDFDGIHLYSTGTITSTGSAAITLTGIGAPSAYGIGMSAGGSNIIGGASATGDITLNADKVSLSNISIQTTGNVTVRPRTAGTTVGVGTGAGTLNLSTALLNSIAAGSITIGDTATTGAMEINTSAVFAEGVTFLTRAGSDITLSGQLNSFSAGNAFVLASGRNFINTAGASAFNLTGGGRWLTYSTSPAALGGLTSSFRRFFCTYGGSCPSLPAAGNGFLYSLPLRESVFVEFEKISKAASEPLKGLFDLQYEPSESDILAAMAASPRKPHRFDPFNTDRSPRHRPAH